LQQLANCLHKQQLDYNFHLDCPIFASFAVPSYEVAEEASLLMEESSLIASQEEAIQSIIVLGRFQEELALSEDFMCNSPIAAKTVVVVITTTMKKEHHSFLLTQLGVEFTTALAVFQLQPVCSPFLFATSLERQASRMGLTCKMAVEVVALSQVPQHLWMGWTLGKLVCSLHPDSSYLITEVTEPFETLEHRYPFPVGFSEQ
jgi:hypothetical protein